MSGRTRALKVVESGAGRAAPAASWPHGPAALLGEAEWNARRAWSTPSGPAERVGRAAIRDAQSEAANETAPHLVEWFRRSARPILFLRPDTLEVRDLNASARALLEARGAVSMVGNRLQLAGGRGAVDAFRTFLAEMESRPRAYAVRDGDDHVILKIKPLPHTGLVAVQVFPARRRGRGAEHVLWADTRAALGLTSAEDRLVKLMMDGANAEEAARQLGVSIDTVRTHVKRAYAKLGVANREQLFATLSAFRLRA